MPNVSLSPKQRKDPESSATPARKSRRRHGWHLGSINAGRAAWSAIKHFFLGDGLIYSGYIAFTGLFALFPFLIALLALAGLLGQGEAADKSIELAFELVPQEVAGVLRPAVGDVRTQATGGLLTLGFLLAMWFASSGLESLRHALNVAYGANDPVHFVVARLQSLLLTAVSAVAIILVVAILIAGPLLHDVLEWLIERRLFDREAYQLVRLGLGLVIMLGLTVLLHLVLPGVRLRLYEVMPGCLLSVVLWVAAAELYSAYLRSLARYSVTYGSLAGIVVTLFFFYISAAVFIFGAQFNGALRRQRLGIPGS
ncbi:YihY/virulence factor BrkB family protein [Geminicoccaceae bacterium 1502E]|nr:YihY/virulence factor BrkB family protein [Geminicoccaceae bacterium 1502E]